MRVVLIGPQGSGKGTQGAALASLWDVPHVATGDILRSEMERENSPYTAEICCINRGNHVSDALIGELLYTRLVQPDVDAGFILDGYPRNLVQARILEDWLEKKHLKLNRVIALDVPEDILIARLVGRAQKEGRTDDTTSVSILRRLTLYKERTLPVLSFYEEYGLLVRVTAIGTPEEVTKQIVLALSKK